jgi:hypothetical protein
VQLDLVNEEQKKEVLAAIRSVTNHATIIECQLNDESKRPPIKDVLGTNTFSVQRALEVGRLRVQQAGWCQQGRDSKQMLRRPGYGASRNGAGNSQGAYSRSAKERMFGVNTERGLEHSWWWHSQQAVHTAGTGIGVKIWAGQQSRLQVICWLEFSSTCGSMGSSGGAEMRPGHFCWSNSCMQQWAGYGEVYADVGMPCSMQGVAHGR